MDSREFLDTARYAVVQYLKEYAPDVKIGDTFVVWSCKILQNNKALIGTDIDASYYEATFNGDREELYLDVYEKDDHICIPLGDDEEPVKPDKNHRVITGIRH